jgi:hypothetical protein
MAPALSGRSGGPADNGSDADRLAGHSSILACTIADASGEITALFYGRSHLPGLGPGSYVRLRGTVSASNAGTVLINPAHELLGRCHP